MSERPMLNQLGDPSAPGTPEQIAAGLVRGTARQVMRGEPGCVFCDIIAGKAPATFAYTWHDAVAIFPRADARGRRGCTEGHLLVIPRQHVRDFTESSEVAALTAARASEVARHLGGQWNEITSAGEDATQTVFHLHRHLVPRRPNDGLALPWTGQQSVSTHLEGDNQ